MSTAPHYANIFLVFAFYVTGGQNIYDLVRSSTISSFPVPPRKRSLFLVQSVCSPPPPQQHVLYHTDSSLRLNCKISFFARGSFISDDAQHGSNGCRGNQVGTHSITHVLLLLLLLLFTAIGLSPGGSGYFTCIQNMKLVTTKLNSGGLHENHVVATWNLGNHLSICL